MNNLPIYGASSSSGQAISYQSMKNGRAASATMQTEYLMPNNQSSNNVMAKMYAAQNMPYLSCSHIQGHPIVNHICTNLFCLKLSKSDELRRQLLTIWTEFRMALDTLISTRTLFKTRFSWTPTTIISLQWTFSVRMEKSRFWGAKKKSRGRNLFS